MFSDITNVRNVEKPVLFADSVIHVIKKHIFPLSVLIKRYIPPAT